MRIVQIDGVFGFGFSGRWGVRVDSDNAGLCHGQRELVRNCLLFYDWFCGLGFVLKKQAVANE